MAFSDPQSLTYNGVANSMPLTSRDGSSAQYTNADGSIRLTVSHQKTNSGRWRRTLRVDHSKIASDPWDTSLNQEVSMTFYCVFDTPVQGYTIAEQKYLWDAFEAFATASTDAAITKVLGGES